MEMTASTEAGVGEFSDELGGRHHLKPNMAVPDDDPAPVTDPPDSGGGTMQPHDGMPSAHVQIAQSLPVETEASKA
jgi:hypothetical protein